jgi:hypothetical protein
MQNIVWNQRVLQEKLGLYRGCICSLDIVFFIISSLGRISSDVGRFGSYASEGAQERNRLRRTTGRDDGVYIEDTNA